jgi:hypothetical protein
MGIPAREGQPSRCRRPPGLPGVLAGRSEAPASGPHGDVAGRVEGLAGRGVPPLSPGAPEPAPAARSLRGASPGGEFGWLSGRRLRPDQRPARSPSAQRTITRGPQQRWPLAGSSLRTRWPTSASTKVIKGFLNLGPYVSQRTPVYVRGRIASGSCSPTLCGTETAVGVARTGEPLQK